jgi:hypothetical protein
LSTTAVTEIGKCRWCGMIHGPMCPSVKSIEYHADGVTVKHVEFRDYNQVPYQMPAWRGDTYKVGQS